MSESTETLHIGLLNMMADGALAATERQFQGLLDGGGENSGEGEGKEAATGPRCVLHPFSFPEILRGEAGAAYVAEHYEDFAKVSARGLDAMIITGANIPSPGLPEQPFWEPLMAVMEWSRVNVRSTLCSCLATHAVLEFRFRQKRSRMPRKLWGVYRHEVMDRGHSLVRGLDEWVDVPHSRFNEITVEQFEAAGLKVLMSGPEGGVHLVVENCCPSNQPGGGPCPLVLFQGHPEYDDVSLLKEYRREISRYVAGKRADYPVLLDFTLDEIGERMCRDHWREVMGLEKGADAPEFQEAELLPHVMGTWHEAVGIVFRNWVLSLAPPEK